MVNGENDRGRAPQRKVNSTAHSRQTSNQHCVTGSAAQEHGPQGPVHRVSARIPAHIGYSTTLGDKAVEGLPETVCHDLPQGLAFDYSGTLSGHALSRWRCGVCGTVRRW